MKKTVIWPATLAAFVLLVLLSLSMPAVAQEAASYSAPRHDAWRILGPGGGGAQFYPAVSPHDPNLVLVACDMTGAYISEDGGKSWRMFELRHPVGFFAFDPAGPQGDLRGRGRFCGGAPIVAAPGAWCIRRPTPRPTSSCRMTMRVPAFSRPREMREWSRPWLWTLKTQRRSTRRLAGRGNPLSKSRKTGALTGNAQRGSLPVREKSLSILIRRKMTARCMSWEKIPSASEGPASGRRPRRRRAWRGFLMFRQGSPQRVS